MQTKPLVSFIIPVLNGERYLARCLAAIRQQRWSEEDYEVLILDNGSTDRTHQLIRDAGFTFHLLPTVNVSTLRNYGTRLAHGAYLAFVDADVELSSDWLQQALASFTDRHIVASGCFPGIPHDATWVQHAWDLHQRGQQPMTTPAPTPWLPSMNLMVRCEAFLAVSGFNEQLETAEDVDLCYRLAQHGTILNNPAMRAIHWGEARDVRTFWRKERWRGLGNLSGVLSHGWRWDEVPSLGYPLYIIVAVLGLVLAVATDLWRQQLGGTPLGLVFLVGPALCLAMHTARRANRLSAVPGLFLLYLVYGLARAWAVCRGLTAQRPHTGG